MLWNASVLDGYAISASDGQLGTVSDFLFDDASWLVRWLVVDTGNWLSGRKVLLPVSILGHVDEAEKKFAVRLTMKQIKDSPDINTERPVSRQMETSVYDYYGWTPYWGNGLFSNGYGIIDGYGFGATSVAQSPPISSDQRREREIADAQRDQDDQHLRSINAVADYHIHASDGEIGHVEDFLVEDADWSIRYLVVDTKNWWPAKKVLISPRSAGKIDWKDKLVNLNVDRRMVKGGPTYDASTTVDRAYETHFREYYGDVQPGHQPDQAVVA
jgi:hypothetical protein